MAIKDKSDTEYFEWTAEDEIQLFFALDGLKPVGIHKHFFMACIVERLSKALNREISSEAVWTHLKTMYNLKALDDMEPLPFPNEETDFCLPDSEFSSVIKRKSVEVEKPVVLAVAVEDVVKKVEVKREPTPKPAKPLPTKEKETEKDEEKEKEEEKEKVREKERKERDIKAKLKIDMNDGTPKRSQKRTRGSVSLESNSPANTPPIVQSTKRRRI